LDSIAEKVEKPFMVYYFTTNYQESKNEAEYLNDLIYDKIAKEQMIGH
jgi:hypothetical protein